MCDECIDYIQDYPEQAYQRIRFLEDCVSELRYYVRSAGQRANAAADVACELFRAQLDGEHRG